MSRTKTDSIKGDELLSFESVKTWIASLEQCAISRHKPFTLGAKRQRLGRMLEYTKFTGKNPDELFEEAKQDITKAGDKLNGYLAHKESKGIDHNTAVTNLSFLRGFYTHNNLVFPKKYRIPTRTVSKVAKRDSKTEMYEYNEETDQLIFKSGKLQQFIQNLNFRDQTVALCLISTGADASDLLNLKIEFIKDGKGDVSQVARFLWEGNRAKDGIPFKVYMSREATEFLRRYVEQERKGASDNEPLFVQNTREYTRINSKTKEREEVVVGEQMPEHSLALNFRAAATKMGYTKKDESHPFRPKRFRHLFRTACSNAGIDNGLIEAFMGHASSMSASYLEQGNGLFIKAYVKVEPFITVFGMDNSAVTEINQRQADMEAKIDENKESVADLTNKNRKMEAEVTELKESLKSATELVYSFEPILNTFNSIAGTPEGQELIKRLHEDKLKREMKEAETEDNKLKDEVLKEHPIAKKK